MSHNEKAEVQMGAKQKLNSIYGTGAFVAAALVGGANQSWGVFFVALILLLWASYHSGSIRR
jgi:hypothetical protein